MYSNIFYFDNINEIGGVESFFYYIARLYKDKDITIFYSTGDAKQLKRLSRLVRTEKYVGQKIKCKKAFFNYSKKIIDHVEATEEYGEIFHGIPERQEEIHPKITHLYGVSQVVCDAVTKMTGRECTLVYNPIDLDKPKRVLKLISATRLTAEKGRDRIIRLGEILDKLGIPYLWLIFTNDTNKIDNPSIVYMKPKLDILNYINECDFLVQLSDTEAYCYSVVESLMIGKPVIVTDLPIFNELGLNENNSIKLALDFISIDKNKLFKDYKFTYNPPKDIWSKILTKDKSTYDPNKKIKVKCIEKYYDVELNKNITPNDDPYEVSFDRYIELIQEPALVEKEV